MKSLLALIALSALAAACHEERRDPPPDYGTIHRHSEAEHRDLQQQHPSDPGQGN